MAIYKNIDGNTIMLYEGTGMINSILTEESILLPNKDSIHLIFDPKKHGYRAKYITSGQGSSGKAPSVPIIYHKDDGLEYDPNLTAKKVINQKGVESHKQTDPDNSKLNYIAGFIAYRDEELATVSLYGHTLPDIDKRMEKLVKDAAKYDEVVRSVCGRHITISKVQQALDILRKED